MAIDPPSTRSYNMELKSIRVDENTGVQEKETHEEPKSMLTGLIQPVMVEFIGTLFFILIGLLGTCNDENKNNSLITAFSFGFALITVIVSFGHISGCHLNPAVTVAMFIVGAIKWLKALLYVVVQLSGAIAAAGIFRLVTNWITFDHCRGDATFLMPVKNATDGSGAIVDYTKWWQAWIVETLLTFMFVTVILMVCKDQRAKTPMAPLYIGLALFACVLASNPLTGGSLNPARTLGSAVVANEWQDNYIYWIGPLWGGALAGILYRFIWGTTDQNLFERHR